MRNFCEWFYFQASPSDPENFPFVVLGNKIDVDGGNSRVVSYFCPYGLIAYWHLWKLSELNYLQWICFVLELWEDKPDSLFLIYIILHVCVTATIAISSRCRFLRRKQRHGVLPREIYHTSKPLQKKVLMLKLLSSV